MILYLMPLYVVNVCFTVPFDGNRAFSTNHLLILSCQIPHEATDNLD